MTLGGGREGCAGWLRASPDVCATKSALLKGEPRQADVAIPLYWQAWY